MKNLIKVAAVALCIAIVGMTLCSCQFLEDRKNERAIYTDSTKSSFVFHDTTYKKIDSLPKNMSFIFSSEAILYGTATMDDIPLLLASTYGDSLNYSDQEKIPTVISCYQTDDETKQDYNLRHRFFGGRYAYIYDESGKTVYYVREDKYDDIEKVIDNAVLDHYCAQVYHPDDITVPYESGEYVNELIPDNVSKAIENALEKGKMSSLEDLHGGYWDTLDIYTCDKDVILSDNQTIKIIADHTDVYLAQTSDYDYVMKLVKVDDKDVKLFRELLDDEKFSNTVTEEDLGYLYDSDTSIERAVEGEGDSSI